MNGGMASLCKPSPINDVSALDFLILSIKTMDSFRVHQARSPSLVYLTVSPLSVFVVTCIAKDECQPSIWEKLDRRAEPTMTLNATISGSARREYPAR